MKTNKKHKRLGFSDYIKYFGNKISNKDKHAFEKKVMENPFDEEAFDGISEISFEEFTGDIKELKNKLSIRRQHRMIPMYLSIAASIAIICVVGISIYYLNKSVGKADQIAINTPEKELKSEAAEKVAEPKLLDEITENKERKGNKIQKPLPVIDQNKIKDEKQPERIVYNKESFSVSEEPKSEIEFAAVEKVQSLSEEVNVVSDKEPEVAKTVDNEALSGSMVSSVEPETKAKIEEKTDEKKMKNIVKSVASRAEPAKVRFEIESSEKVSETDNRIIVRGIVVDANDNTGLPGVNVIERGTTNGIVTDMDGKFELEVEQDSKIDINYIGYLSQEIEAENNDFIEIKLVESMMALNEVVVVGYSSAKRSETNNTEFVSAQPSIKNKDYDKYIHDQLGAELVDRYNGEIVKIEFNVNENGALSGFKIIKTPDEGLAKNIIKIIKNGPIWIPAKSDDDFEESTVRIRVKLKK